MRLRKWSVTMSVSWAAGKEKRLDVGVGEWGYSEGHRVIDTTDNNQTKLDIYTQRERTQRERTQREKTQRERTQREKTPSEEGVVF